MLKYLDSLETLDMVADTDCYNTMELIIGLEKENEKQANKPKSYTIPRPSSLELRLSLA